MSYETIVRLRSVVVVEDSAASTQRYTESEFIYSLYEWFSSEYIYTDVANTQYFLESVNRELGIITLKSLTSNLLYPFVTSDFIDRLALKAMTRRLILLP